MSGEREAAGPDANREDNLSTDQEDIDTEAESFDEGDEIRSDQEDEEGESSIVNVVGRISAKMDLLEVTQAELQQDVDPSMEWEVLTRKVGPIGDWVALDVTGRQSIYHPGAKFPSYERMWRVDGQE